VTPAAVLVAAASVAAAAGCARRASPPPPPPGPIGSALLALAGELGTPPAEVAAAWVRAAEIAGRVAERRRQDGGDLAAALDAVVFGDLGFAREIEDPDLRFLTLPGVIESRRGGCLGLGALYLVLAELLGAPLEGVLVPGHFFVRVPGPPSRNLEMLRRGEVMPDTWYQNKYGPWPQGPSSAYGRAVSVAELVAIHWFNAGNLGRRTGDLAGAGRGFARAAAGFPAFAEAQASLGAVLQLQGRLAEAESAYRAAARARSDLPGLADNLAWLVAERVGSAPPTKLQTKLQTNVQTKDPVAATVQETVEKRKPLAVPSIQ
jgi:tetratricopeptide (TPR) repeat protein